MSAHRNQSPILNVDVLYAPGRSTRPGAFGDRASDCPFCPGNEHMTPPALAQLPGDGDWDLRVVPNLYPITGTPASPLHEVVIESPRHDESIFSWPLERTERVVRLWLERLDLLRARSDVAFAFMFRNEGRAAGASLEHPHSQVIALPAKPPRTTGGSDPCAICTDLDQSSTVLRTSGDLVAWCPSPSAFPWEIAISTRAHEARVPRDSARSHAAVLLQQAIRAWQGRGIASGNILLIEQPDSGHWTLSLLPRVTGIAGFELATGLMINVIDERSAADDLRAWFSDSEPTPRSG